MTTTKTSASDRRIALITEITTEGAFPTWEAAARHAAEVGPAMGTRKKDWAAACGWAVATMDETPEAERTEDLWKWATLQGSIWMGYANI